MSSLELLEKLPHPVLSTGKDKMRVEFDDATKRLEIEEFVAGKEIANPVSNLRMFITLQVLFKSETDIEEVKSRALSYDEFKQQVDTMSQKVLEQIEEISQ